MRLGMPTLIEHASIAESAALCKELGLSFVELNMNLPTVCHAMVSGEAHEIERLNALINEYGVYFTIHLDEYLNVCDFNPAVSNAYRETIRSTIRTAKQIGAPIINMHLHKGVHFTLPDGKAYLYERYHAHYMQSIRLLREICEAEIGGSGVMMCIENTSGFMDFEEPAIECLLQSEAFGLTWDIGHCHCAQNKDEPFILSHANKLRHFHLHDARGSKNHLPLSEGEIDLQARIAIAKERDCRCVIETKTSDALLKSVIWLCNSTY